MNPTLSYLLVVERCQELRAQGDPARGAQPPARRVAEAAVQPPSSRRRALRAALLKISGQPTPMDLP